MPPRRSAAPRQSRRKRRESVRAGRRKRGPGGSAGAARHPPGSGLNRRRARYLRRAHRTRPSKRSKRHAPEAWSVRHAFAGQSAALRRLGTEREYLLVNAWESQAAVQSWTATDAEAELRAKAKGILAEPLESLGEYEEVHLQANSRQIPLCEPMISYTGRLRHADLSGPADPGDARGNR